MSEAIASISEARAQLQRARRRQTGSTTDSKTSDPETPGSSDTIGNASPDASDDTGDVQDVGAIQNRDRSLLRSGPYPISDPQNQTILER